MTEAPSIAALMTDTDEPEAKEGWSITNDQEADWAMKKIRDAEAECDRWTRYYKAMIKQVEDNTAVTRSIMEQKLHDYFMTVPHKETKTQAKYSLPSGDLVVKRPKNVIEIADENKLLEWVKSNGLTECLKVIESVRWAEVKKRLTEDSNGVICDSETGLVCDAVKSVPKDAEFSVYVKN